MENYIWRVRPAVRGVDIKEKGIGNNYHATIEFDFKNKD